MLENINNNIKNIFSEKDFLFSERQSSYERFLNLGLPNKRIEDWKYTGFSKLNRFFSQDILDVTFRLKKEHDQDVEILDLDFSKIDSNDYIKPQNYVKNEAIIDLNLALSSQFKVIDIKNSQKKPIVIFIDTTEEGMFLPRIYINVFEGVSAEILIINAGLKGFINQLVEFNLDKNSKLIVNRVNLSETDFIETNISYLKKGSCLNIANLSIPKNASRYQGYNFFEEEEAIYNIKTISIPKPNSNDDILTKNFHRSSGCSSSSGIRAVLGEKTVGTFQSLIDVKKGVKNTIAEQDCRAILLSKDSCMNVKPEMRIFNDNVVCKHGATIGSLDSNQIFYMLTRGLNEEEVKNFLIKSFIDSYIPNDSPLKKYLPGNFQ